MFRTRSPDPVERTASAVPQDTIFVQIPAYRDSELAKTLLDLYAKAADPARLRTCVVWQHAADETLPPSVRALPGLEIVEVPAAESKGCNWARRLGQLRWAGEPFTMLLDSHHRFTRGWDDLVIAMYRQLQQQGSDNPLLTAYLPAYDPDREPGGRKKRPYKIYPLGRELGILTKLTSYPIPLWTKLTSPIPAEFLSLHFVFTAGEFNRAIPFDPDLYFFGDEVATGLRAFTAGFDLYHPHRVVAWHCYNRASRIPHWDDHPEWPQRHRQSLDRMGRLFRGDPDTATVLGTTLGTARTVADYEDHIMTRLVDAP